MSLFTKFACAAALVGSAYASPNPTPANNNNGGSSGGLTLSSNAVQSGSFVDGSKQIGAAEVGQALSTTSTDNFINFCSGQTLTNGLQITTGSCNGIPMGQLPAKTAMVSSVITNPSTGKSIASGQTFNISVQTSNLAAGSFTNADATYFAAPQTLSGGKVVGHTHVSVQDMGNSLNPTTPLDATQFAFFKGINDAGNGKGLLQATVTGGLPAGNYRVCTMASSSNHAPVVMPVAQRGAQDDCTKFTVTGNDKTANAASNNGSGGVAAAAAAASAVKAGPGAVDTATSSAAAGKAQATAANNNNNNNNNNNANANANNANNNKNGQAAAAAAAAKAGAAKGGQRKNGRKARRNREFIA